MNTSKYRKLITGAVVGLALAGSGAANAGCNEAQCSGLIDTLYYDANGNLNIRLVGVNIPAESNCTGTANYAQVASNHERLKEFYALALTAYALGNPFSVRMASNSPTCSVSYVFMSAQ